MDGALVGGASFNRTINQENFSENGNSTNDKKTFLADAQAYVLAYDERNPSSLTPTVVTSSTVNNRWSLLTSGCSHHNSSSSSAPFPSSSCSTSYSSSSSQPDGVNEGGINGGFTAAFLVIAGWISAIRGAILAPIATRTERRLNFLEKPYDPIRALSESDADDRNQVLIREIYQQRFNMLTPRVVSPRVSSGLFMAGAVAGVAMIASAYFQSNEAGAWSGGGALVFIGLFSLIKWRYEGHNRSARESNAVEAIRSALAELSEMQKQLDGPEQSALSGSSTPSLPETSDVSTSSTAEPPATDQSELQPHEPEQPSAQPTFSEPSALPASTDSNSQAQDQPVVTGQSELHLNEATQSSEQPSVLSAPGSSSQAQNQPKVNRNELQEAVAKRRHIVEKGTPFSSYDWVIMREKKRQ